MVDNEYTYNGNRFSDEEMALVDELIENRIPLPEVINADTLSEALEATRSSDYLSFIRR